MVAKLNVNDRSAAVATAFERGRCRRAEASDRASTGHATATLMPAA
jgi:hypothetical protein